MSRRPRPPADEPSPAERYARWDAERRTDAGELARFRSRFPFDLDPFQVDGCLALEEGSSVLVAAPTGAGKTVVGEFAVQLALAQGRKVFYTAPIKALSNQKHAELSAWLGAERVGLLTGDLSVRPEADVLVMTTEVLRNMLYASSRTLDGLGYVVMDEVHYLADRLRGPVWEEVIIQLPAAVQLVSLSATVSNAEEFGAWLQEVRGSTRIVVSETRPVPLWQHVLVGEQLMDLFVDEDGRAVVSHGPGASADRIVNPQLERLSATSEETSDHRAGGRGRGRSGRGRPGPRRGGHEQRRRPAPRAGWIPRPATRPQCVMVLDEDALLPAIFFVFSRTGCEAAVRQCAMAHLRLTTAEEQRAIRELLDERLALIGHEDLEVLGIPSFRRAAEHGFAAHHAGMLPLLKGIVEELFAAGLVKAVFATETLALGINMPARSVVLEKLSKFNGVEHADLTPGEYTQLTGRAGRRGIDTEGHAVVVAGPGFDADAVAALASRRTYPLRSAFRPTYNMAVNLLDRYDARAARESLEMSFAQFQTDRSVVGLARRARELEETVIAYRGAIGCERGDIAQYDRLRQAVSDRESELSRERSARDRDRTRHVLRDLRRGEIIALPGGKRQGFAVVVAVEREVMGGPQVLLVDTDGRTRTLRPGDVPGPPAVIATMKVPAADRLRQAKVRKDTGAALRGHLAGRESDPRRAVRASARTPSTAATDERLQALRAQLHAHPCHECPDREAHLRWIARTRSAEKEHRSALARIEGRTSSLARQFDRICSLLTELGYLTAEGGEEAGGLRPTPDGLRLRRLFSERDLLIAQCVREGILARLDAPALAAVISALCYEPRRDDGGSAELPADPAVERALIEAGRLGERLNAAERRLGLEVTAPPDAGICAVMHRWASGEHYAAAVGTTGLPAGDFVRQCRQVIDLLDQLARIPDAAPSARAAIDRVRRGVVSQEIDR